MPETIEVLEDGGNIDDGLKWQIIFTGCNYFILNFIL